MRAIGALNSQQLLFLWLLGRGGWWWWCCWWTGCCYFLEMDATILASGFGVLFALPAFALDDEFASAFQGGCCRRWRGGWLGADGGVMHGVVILWIQRSLEY